MDFRKVWVITKSLLLSQLRATSSTGRAGIRSLIRRPRILGIVDAIVFAAATILSYFIARTLESLPSSSSSSPALILYTTSLVHNFIVILPAIILGLLLVLGLVLEVSSGAQFASSDTVNWMPVRASEYVAASTLSLLIYYSVFPVAIIGAAMSFAYVFGIFPAWELATFLSLFSIIVATSVLEIARAVLNRFSSSFYKRGGRAAIALRAIVGIIIIVIFQTLFYPQVYERFLGIITPTLGPTWFVPILWGSVSVTTLLSGDLATSTMFALLEVSLAAVLFYAAVAARSKYWVPMPPAIRISSAVYAPKRGFASVLLNPTQLAITRKDLRGLVRRREMTRILALPGVFLITAFLSATSGGGLSFAIYFGLFIVAFTTLYVAMASIGSEGKSILNLYQMPVHYRDFVVGKAVPPITFGTIFGVIFYIVIAIISPHDVMLASFFAFSSIALAFEMAFIGMLLGMRFPNFSESPRAAFVSQVGGLIAFPLAVLVAGLSMSPLLVASALQFGLSEMIFGFVGCIIIAGVACFVFYRIAVSQAHKLFAQIPV